MEYLTARDGAPATEQEIAIATGREEHLVRVMLREASDRDWARYVPGQGWRLP
jgi:hypothetical protein